MKRPTISKRNFLKVVKSTKPCKLGLKRLENKLKVLSASDTIDYYVENYSKFLDYVENYSKFPEGSKFSHARARDWNWFSEMIGMFSFQGRTDRNEMVKAMNARLDSIS